MDLEVKDRIALRDEIIRQVEAGELAPEKAEERAAQNGLAPLATTPAPDRFDPMTLNTWTLAMALAWITWRSPDMVRECWDDYRRECWRWKSGSGRGYHLEHREKASVALLQLDQTCECLPNDDLLRSPRRKSVGEAKKELWRMLEAGAVEATAVNIATGERVVISAAAWPTTRLIEHWTRDELQVCHLVACCDGIELSAQNLMDIWVPRSDPALEMPAIVAPEGSGQMSIFSAAHWIATRGGAERDRPNLETWRVAYQQLLEQVVAGKVEVIGTRPTDGVSEVIDPVEFSDCIVSQPFDDQDDTLLFGTELVLVSTPNVRGDMADGGDSLRNRHGPRWIRLRVAKADVAAAWPFVRDATSYLSGEPGRPSAKVWVIPEYRARCQRGEMGTSQRSDAKVLAKWLPSEHPNAPSASWQTIESYIREERENKKGFEVDSKQ